MAPKRGGGSSSSGGSRGSGSSSCTYCLQPLQLYGSDWKDGKTNAIFAFECIAIVVLLGCLILSTRYRWIREAGKDKLRNTGYKIAAFSQLVSYVLYVVDIALGESQHTTTYLYYLIFIFANGGWRLAEILILGIILRTLRESTASTLGRVLRPVHILAMILLSLLSLAGFGMVIAEYSRIISARDYLTRRDPLYTYMGNVSVAYQSLYFVAAILAAAEALLVLIKERSKATFLMLVVVAPCLFLRSLMNLVNTAVNYFPQRGTAIDDARNLSFASWIIYHLMTMGIFLGVVIIGYFASRRRVQQEKVVGANDAPFGTYN